MRALLTSLSLLAAILFTGASGCTRSRTETIRDRATLVERKLEAERDRALNGGYPPSTRDQCISHLQTLRTGLSMVNISLASVPLLLKDDTQREIGYSVLDEALGTIDWNIPIYQQGASNLRPYPSLFSPQKGLDFMSIQAGAQPGLQSPNNPTTPPGFAH